MTMILNLFAWASMYYVYPKIFTLSVCAAMIVFSIPFYFELHRKRISYEASSDIVKRPCGFRS